ncbi:DEAD/DEAH box helicase family protein [Segatella copri]|uniref:DEAD/DEAH box helicase family protein n=1 Tax=Segatella copri TaxID=165179 RepID=UPI003F8BCB49
MAINSSNISLELAHRLTDVVNAAWKSGVMLEKVTPTTASLLNYWFGEGFCNERARNFHEGQRQAVLNIIYLHEVMGENCVMDAYQGIIPELMDRADLAQLAKPKYQMPKYAVKMATGTGKTWVMHALIIWQMLNARHEDVESGRFTQKFLIVAPGLIVYDRLLDAFCGRKKRDEEYRDPQTNDYYMNQEVFIPERYRDEVFSFIQNNVVTKEDGIGRKTTGEGLIALTNWHLFENQMEEKEQNENVDDSSTVTPSEIISDLLPIRPGKSAGNDLGMLDRRALGGTELEYLAGLKDLMVINDEAHHIHEIKRNGETEEVEWQRGLNAISATKGTRFIQVDFSATPFDTKGTGEKQVKLFFPHIIVDFDLPMAMKQGLVKLLLLDRRQELTDLENLDYNAERDEQGKVVGLSEGQRMMLRAGLTKLNKLEEEFLKNDASKNPKMLIVCQDTTVSPFVEEFLKSEGLEDEDIVTIDSNKQGEVKDEEWQEIKKKLFDIDRYKSPKVVISVLMLREGFDVNNICVLVPLRSSQAPILLEQLVGRGLRLMWRESDYIDIKREDRLRVLKNHQPPRTYIDTLSIVEHPAFIKFYDDLQDQGLVAVDEGDVGAGGATGDILTVGLREDYGKYDFQWPVILHDSIDEFEDAEIDLDDLEPFTMYPLPLLRKFLAKEGETFVSQESLTKTTFGKYKVTANLFNASGYNEYLQKLLRVVTLRFENCRRQGFPTIQINGAQTVQLMDWYIREKLFSAPFNPFQGNDWKILLAKDGIVTKHIVEQFAVAIYKMQNRLTTINAEVSHTDFSSLRAIKMRESYSMEVQKCIYPRLGYPSHGGGLEKAFIEFLDRDAEVERFLKINENGHSFAIIFYVRKDGLMATYHPDFIVATGDKVYLIETKGDDKVDDVNVRQKQTATVEWIKKINALEPGDRMNRTWEYVLVGESVFYSLSGSGATITDICNMCKVSYSVATGNLFDM